MRLVLRPFRLEGCSFALSTTGTVIAFFYSLEKGLTGPLGHASRGSEPVAKTAVLTGSAVPSSLRWALFSPWHAN